MLRLPAERSGIRELVDPNCESLPESLARTRLRIDGHRLQSQVRMSGGRAIDLVVDGVIGIEVDGEEFHAMRFYPDREKDIDITLMGMHAMRPTAAMVFGDWDRFLRSVEAAISMHRNSPVVLGNSGNRSRPWTRSSAAACHLGCG